MDYISIAKRQFLKDYALKKFPTERVLFQKAKQFSSAAMNYLQGTPFLNMVYFGENLFISADCKISDFIKRYVKQCEPDLFRVFDAPNLMRLDYELNGYGYTVAHLAQYFLPDPQFKEEQVFSFSLKLFQDKEILELYTLEFPMALCGTITGKRRDVLAVACFIDEKIVGVAACTNDSDTMWQIGVDVLKEYRRRGIATALVLRLKEEILRLGKCPFYCCAWSNLASKAVARKTGFKDGWVELSAKSLQEDWISKIRNI